MDPGSPYQWLKEMRWEDRGLYLIRLLRTCAKYIESGNFINADTGLEYISHMASPEGDAMQRVATYVGEGLAYLVFKDLRGVPRALRLSKHLTISEEQLAKRFFFQLCPFLKLAFVITNQAIVEAMEGEKLFQILDLNASDPGHWIRLFHNLKERQKNQPLIKIIGIHENQEILDQVGFQLTQEAEKLGFPFQFRRIVSKLENLDIESLPIVTGEPLAISSVLQLHSLAANDDKVSRNSPAESSNLLRAIHKKQTTFAEWLGKHKIKPSPDSALSPLPVCSSPKIECFLNGLWKLQPRLMVITERELNHTSSTLSDRVDKALHFYGALFDCLESTVSRTSVERQIMERMLLGEEIMNMITCEGVDKKERIEKLENWIPCLELAGFGRVDFSYDGRMQATNLLQSYGNGYKLRVENNCLLICWNDTPLFSVSAWRF